jgi:hypothetical protein
MAKFAYCLSRCAALSFAISAAARIADLGNESGDHSETLFDHPGARVPIGVNSLDATFAEHLHDIREQAAALSAWRVR